MVHIYYNPTSGNVSNTAAEGYEPYINAQKVAEMKDMADKETKKWKSKFLKNERLNFRLYLKYKYDRKDWIAERIYLWLFIALIIADICEWIAGKLYAVLIVVNIIWWIASMFFNVKRIAKEARIVDEITDEEIIKFTERTE